MRVIGYLRVSTERQVDRFGLPVQERQVRTWCKAGGHRLVAVFTDEGESGSNGLQTRLALGEALNALRERRAAGLVVPRLDRLARDLIVQEQLLAEVRRIGAEVFSCSAAEAGFLADDPDDPSRKLIRQVLGAVSEYERAMVVLRMRRGRARKAEQGGFAYGSPPLGSRAEGGALVADEREAATVARIAELHAAGRSLRQIAAALEAEGYRPKRADRWHPQSLARVIARAGAG